MLALGGLRRAGFVGPAFQRAQAIREAFFRDGGRQLGMRLEWRLLELEPGVAEFALDVDGRKVDALGGGGAS